MNRTFTKMWRWSLLSALVVGAYWLEFFLLKGFVPVETTMGFWTNSWVLVKLNFPVSRWFDILIGPIWLSVLIFWANTSQEFNDNYITTIGLFELFVWMAIAICCVDALFTGIVTGFATTILACLFVVVIGALILLGRLIVNWANAK